MVKKQTQELARDSEYLDLIDVLAAVWRAKIFVILSIVFCLLCLHVILKTSRLSLYAVTTEVEMTRPGLFLYSDLAESNKLISFPSPVFLSLTADLFKGRGFSADDIAMFPKLSEAYSFLKAFSLKFDDQNQTTMLLKISFVDELSQSDVNLIVENLNRNFFESLKSRSEELNSNSALQSDFEKQTPAMIVSGFVKGVNEVLIQLQADLFVLESRLKQELKIQGAIDLQRTHSAPENNAMSYFIKPPLDHVFDLISIARARNFNQVKLSEFQKQYYDIMARYFYFKTKVESQMPELLNKVNETPTKVITSVFDTYQFSSEILKVNESTKFLVKSINYSYRFRSWYLITTAGACLLGLILSILAAYFTRNWSRVRKVLDK